MHRNRAAASRAIRSVHFLVMLLVSAGSFGVWAQQPPGPPSGKLRPATGPIWSGSYNGSADNADEAHALALSPDGTVVYVAGHVNGIGPDMEYATVAYDAGTGQELWTALYNGSVCTDVPQSLAVSPDGARVFVTGYSGCLTEEDYATVAYDAGTGQELWTARYDGPTGDPDEAAALAVSHDGTRVFVTGRSFGPLGEGRDYATLAYDAADGQKLWISRYVGPGLDEESSNDEALGLALSPDGSTVFVTGMSFGEFSSLDYATVAYAAADGGELWVARYDGPPGYEDIAQAIAASPDGCAVFVTGLSFAEGTFSDVTTLGYDAATGQELWLQRDDGAVSGFDAGNALAVSPDGTRVFVAGHAEDHAFGYPDYVTLAYDADDGSQDWRRSYNGPGNDSDAAHALAVSPDGGVVYVTGLSAGIANLEFPFDCTTLAYGADSGNVTWFARYNGPSNRSDVPEALAFSPDGRRVFVAGWSYVEDGFDFLTLAYRR